MCASYKFGTSSISSAAREIESYAVRVEGPFSRLSTVGIRTRRNYTDLFLLLSLPLPPSYMCTHMYREIPFTWWKWSPQRGWKVSARSSRWTPCWSPPRPSSFIPMTTTTTNTSTTTAMRYAISREGSERVGGRMQKGWIDNGWVRQRDRDDRDDGDEPRGGRRRSRTKVECYSEPSVPARSEEVGRGWGTRAETTESRELEPCDGGWSGAGFTPVVRERGLTGNNWRTAPPPLPPPRDAMPGEPAPPSTCYRRAGVATPEIRTEERESPETKKSGTILLIFPTNF